MIVIGVLATGATSATAIVEIARRAAGTGARTEILGVAPVGPVGDRQLLQLAAAGVGHATVTRSAAPGIEPADLELALRYLPDIRVIVLVEPGASLLEPSSAASAWSGATLIVVGHPDEGVASTGAATAHSATVDPGATHGGAEPIVLQPPAGDPDGAFAGLVAAFAVRLDAGEAPAVAWQATLATLAVDPA